MAILGDAREFGRPSYSFLRTIAEGNTAITRLFRHDVLNVDQVQKTISLVGLADGIIDSEPRLLEALDHPRVIKVREAQWDPDADPALKAITFTTNYYPGESIHAALAAGHVFSTNEALGILQCMLEGLHYLHVTAGIVHRDVKPGNIMLDSDRAEGFVGDLGSAAYIEKATGGVSASGGTLLYRPPEYASGQLDARSDLYSAGLTLFEMLNGPFGYASLDAAVLVQRAEDGKPTLFPRQLAFQPWVSPAVVSFVKKLIHPDPARRFQSADAALRALAVLRYVDWQQAAPNKWIGRWPPRQPRRKQRLLRVRAEPCAGRFAGMMLLSAASSKDEGRSWRNYASLARRIRAGDGAALGTFFRDVESAAQSVAVR